MGGFTTNKFSFKILNSVSNRSQEMRVLNQSHTVGGAPMRVFVVSETESGNPDCSEDPWMEVSDINSNSFPNSFPNSCP